MNYYLTPGGEPLGVSTYVAGNGLSEEVTDFWEGKEPCWKLLDCSKYVYPNCSAYHHRHKPCWECAYIECKKR